MRFLLATNELDGLRDLSVGPIRFVFKNPLSGKQAYAVFGYMLKLQDVIPDEMPLGICVNIAAYLTDNSIFYAVHPRYDKDIDFAQNMHAIFSTHKLRKSLIRMRNEKTCDGMPWTLCCEAALLNLREKKN